MIEDLLVVSLICILLGVAYPVLAAIAYPIYVILGGKQRFCDYMRKL